MTEQKPQTSTAAGPAVGGWGAARGRAALATALLFLSASRPGQTQQVLQGFTVTPVTVEMAAGQRATILTVQNHTDRAATFQVHAPFAWSQPAGNDQLDPTDGLLVSPPLGVLPPGSSQVVRLGAAPRRSRLAEASYRILLDQLPAEGAPAGQVGFVLRLSFPVASSKRRAGRRLRCAGTSRPRARPSP